MIDWLSHLSTRVLGLVFGIAMVVTIVLAVGSAALTSVISGAVMAQSGSNPSDRVITPDPVDAPAEVAEAAPTDAPSLSQPDASTGLPASCDDLFSPAMRSSIESQGYSLNPGWVAQYDPLLGNRDPFVRDQLERLNSIRCVWALPEGVYGGGIETRVAVVTAVQAQTISESMLSLSFSALNELGSLRFVFSEPNSEYGQIGESHIIVDGLWFATTWYGFGPNGYTADIVNTLRG